MSNDNVKLYAQFISRQVEKDNINEAHQKKANEAAHHHDEMMKFHDKMMDHHRLSAEGAEEEKNPNDKKFHDQEFKKHEKAFKAHEAAREAHIYGDAVADNLSKKADMLTKVKN